MMAGTDSHEQTIRALMVPFAAVMNGEFHKRAQEGVSLAAPNFAELAHAVHDALNGSVGHIGEDVLPRGRLRGVDDAPRLRVVLVLPGHPTRLVNAHARRATLGERKVQPLRELLAQLGIIRHGRQFGPRRLWPGRSP